MKKKKSRETGCMSDACICNAHYNDTGKFGVQDHTVKIEGNYDQNSDTSVVRGSLLIGKDYRAKAGRLTIGEKKKKQPGQSRRIMLRVR